MPGGGDPNYSSLAIWDSASDNNLAGYSGPVILDCYDSQDHDDDITLSGATNTSTTVYRKIRSSPYCAIPFLGVETTGACFTPSGTTATAFRTSEAYARIESVSAKITLNNLTSYYAFHSGSGSAGAVGVKFINCIAFDCTNVGAGGAGGFYGTAAAEPLFYNCIAKNGDYLGFYIYGYYTISVLHAVAINCVAINNASYGFYGVNLGNGRANVFNCYAADNASGDFNEGDSYWSTTSGWNASKDNTSDLGVAVAAYKNGLDLIALGKMDSDGLALDDDLYDASSASSSYGRNPYDDFTATSDCYDFLKNDTAGDSISKKDIRGTDRLAPDTADTSWNVGASENFSIKLFYRTGATSELCAAATYIRYILPFDSEGFVQLRVEE